MLLSETFTQTTREGAIMWPYFFKLLQSFVGELESAVQGAAMLNQVKLFQHGSINSLGHSERGVEIIGESVEDCRAARGCYGSEWMWTDVEWAGAVWREEGRGCSWILLRYKFSSNINQTSNVRWVLSFILYFKSFHSETEVQY